MPPLTFLPQLHGLHLDSIAVTGDRIALTVTTVRRTARCPLCQSRSRRMQSRYTRTLMDLPWSGHSVFLQIRCKRRFANGQSAGIKVVRVRRLPQLVPVLARTALTAIVVG